MHDAAVEGSAAADGRVGEETLNLSPIVVGERCAEWAQAVLHAAAAKRTRSLITVH